MTVTFRVPGRVRAPGGTLAGYSVNYPRATCDGCGLHFGVDRNATWFECPVCRYVQPHGSEKKLAQHNIRVGGWPLTGWRNASHARANGAHEDNVRKWINGCSCADCQDPA